jgi:hypothetical protein
MSIQQHTHLVWKLGMRSSSDPWSSRVAQQDHSAQEKVPIVLQLRLPSRHRCSLSSLDHNTITLQVFKVSRSRIAQNSSSLESLSYPKIDSNCGRVPVAGDMYATITRTKWGLFCLSSHVPGFWISDGDWKPALAKTNKCMFSQLLSLPSFNCSPCFSVLSSLSFNCSLSQLLYFDASKSTFKDVWESCSVEINNSRKRNLFVLG